MNVLARAEEAEDDACCPGMVKLRGGAVAPAPAKPWLCLPRLDAAGNGSRAFGCVGMVPWKIDPLGWRVAACWRRLLASMTAEEFPFAGLPRELCGP